MVARPHLMLALVLLGTAAGGAATRAQAGPPIANQPPRFRIYDVDRRERRMKALIAEMEGHPALGRQRADAALGELDDIRRQEAADRVRHGGRLTVPAVRSIDARLNVLSAQIGLREARR